MNKVLKEINKDRYKAEACFVFSCWQEPDLFEDYKDINVGKDETLKNEDAVFYWNLGMAMHTQGIRKIDAIAVDAFLANKEDIRKKYEQRGSYAPINDLSSAIDPENVDSFFDQIARMNSLSTVAKSMESFFSNIDKLSDKSNDDIYDMFELLNNSISTSSIRDINVQDLVITDEFINTMSSHEAMGLPIKNASCLNYTMLGIPLGDCSMLASHSGMGKSSWVAANIVFPLAASGEPVCIFSNEMKIAAYQHLLLIYILTKELSYYELTRKKLKQGNFTEKDLDMLQQAKEISEEKYKNIKFIAVFNNDAGIIMRFIKKFSRRGYRCFIWDTFKSDDITDGTDEWLKLLKNSRKVFNVVSKLEVAMFMTFQLSLHTTNQRYLDASCLAGSKQVKEVLSELLMMRQLWPDEYTGEKNDCRAYKWNSEKKEKEYINLNPEKKYRVFFINKTRNDEGGNEILFQWDSVWNQWYEIGYCNIKNDHRGMG